MIEGIPNARSGGFRPFGSPLDPAIARALAELLLQQLHPDIRQTFEAAVRSVGLAGVLSCLAAHPALIVWWNHLAEGMIVHLTGNTDHYRRLGSDLCTRALTGRKEVRP
jgi:hypothetical protein